MTHTPPTFIRRSLAMAFALGALAHCAGCIYVGPLVWTESQEMLRLPAAGVENLSAVTHNGRVTVTGAKDAGDEIVVQVSKHAGGLTLGDAEACMGALQITTDKQGSTQKLGWKYDGLRHSTWGAKVSFEVTLPPELAVSAVSHNGPIKVNGVSGDCKAQTHNGRISVEARSGHLSVTSHNGRLDVNGAPAEVHLTTHNGSITANLQSPGDLAGSIITHNGGVGLTLGEQTTTRLCCWTHNGRLTCKRDMSDVTVSRSRLSGRLGDTEATLEVGTHNGSIDVR